MSTKIVRIDPRDLDKNKAIGVSLPFNGGGVFNSTYSTKDQIRFNLINLLLTYKGERVLNPKFGADLPRLLFEPITKVSLTEVKDQIIDNVKTYIPEVTINDIEVTPDLNINLIYVKVIYTINLSGDTNIITLEIQ